MRELEEEQRRVSMKIYNLIIKIDYGKYYTYTN